MTRPSDRIPGEGLRRQSRAMTRFMVGCLMLSLLMALFFSVALMATRVAAIEHHLAMEARV